MNYSKNSYKLCFIIFFHNLIPAYVIERLFWEQRGMTVFMVVLCEVIYAATIVLLEVPTGILADKLSRKTLLVFAGVLSMMEFVLLLVADSFFDFGLVVFLAGISGACTSGAFNALLYDSLMVSGEQSRFEKVLGRINALDLTAALLAALSGGLLSRYYPFEVNYVLSAVSMLVALLFILSLKEPPRKVEKQAVKHKASFMACFEEAVQFYKNNPKLAFMMINAMAVGASVNYADEFWQLYLRDAGVAIQYFGLFSALILLIRIPGNLISAYLGAYFKGESMIAFILAITAIDFLVAGIFPGGFGIAALVILFLVSGLLEPLIAGYLHHRVSSDIRATVDSFQSLVKRAIMLVVGLGFGYVAFATTIEIGFGFIGLVCALFCIQFLRNSKKLTA